MNITQLTSDEAKEYIATKNVFILDVRTPQEFRDSHLKNAKLIPVSELPNRIKEIEDQKEKDIIVYCHAGSRSLAACSILQKNGFTQIKNLKGGISHWIQNGNTVVRGT